MYLSAATAAYFHGGLRYRQAATVSLGVSRAALVGQRPEGSRARWVAPGRSKGAIGGARENPGRTGVHPRGPRARRLAPGRTKGASAGAQKDDNSSTVVLVTVVMVVAIV